MVTPENQEESSSDGDAEQAGKQNSELGIEENDESVLLDPPIEPGTPELQNTFFVVLGVLSMLWLIIHLIRLLL